MSSVSETTTQHDLDSSLFGAHQSDPTTLRESSPSMELKPSGKSLTKKKSVIASAFGSLRSRFRSNGSHDADSQAMIQKEPRTPQKPWKKFATMRGTRSENKQENDKPNETGAGETDSSEPGVLTTKKARRRRSLGDFITGSLSGKRSQKPSDAPPSDDIPTVNATSPRHKSKTIASGPALNSLTEANFLKALDLAQGPLNVSATGHPSEQTTSMSVEMDSHSVGSVDSVASRNCFGFKSVPDGLENLPALTLPDPMCNMWATDEIHDDFRAARNLIHGNPYEIEEVADFSGSRKEKESPHKASDCTPKATQGAELQTWNDDIINRLDSLWEQDGKQDEPGPSSDAHPPECKLLESTVTEINGLEDPLHIKQRLDLTCQVLQVTEAVPLDTIKFLEGAVKTVDFDSIFSYKDLMAQQHEILFGGMSQQRGMSEEYIRRQIILIAEKMSQHYRLPALGLMWQISSILGKGKGKLRNTRSSNVYNDEEDAQSGISVDLEPAVNSQEDDSEESCKMKEGSREVDLEEQQLLHMWDCVEAHSVDPSKSLTCRETFSPGPITVSFPRTKEHGPFTRSYRTRNDAIRGIFELCRGSYSDYCSYDTNTNVLHMRLEDETSILDTMSGLEKGQDIVWLPMALKRQEDAEFEEFVFNQRESEETVEIEVESVHSDACSHRENASLANLEDFPEYDAAAPAESFCDYQEPTSTSDCQVAPGSSNDQVATSVPNCQVDSESFLHYEMVLSVEAPRDSSASTPTKSASGGSPVETFGGTPHGLVEPFPQYSEDLVDTISEHKNVYDECSVSVQEVARSDSEYCGSEAAEVDPDLARRYLGSDFCDSYLNGRDSLDLQGEDTTKAAADASKGEAVRKEFPKIFGTEVELPKSPSSAVSSLVSSPDNVSIDQRSQISPLLMRYYRELISQPGDPETGNQEQREAKGKSKEVSESEVKGVEEKAMAFGSKIPQISPKTPTRIPTLSHKCSVCGAVASKICKKGWLTKCRDCRQRVTQQNCPQCGYWCVMHTCAMCGRKPTPCKGCDRSPDACSACGFQPLPPLPGTPKPSGIPRSSSKAKAHVSPTAGRSSDASTRTVEFTPRHATRSSEDRYVPGQYPAEKKFGSFYVDETQTSAEETFSEDLD